MIYIFWAIVAIAAIGAIIGAFRRYTRTSVWGLSVGVTFVAMFYTAKLIGKSAEYYVYIVCGVTAGVFLIATALFALVGKIIGNARESKRRFNSFAVQDELDEVNEFILNSVDKKNTSEYKKLLKRKKKLGRVKTGAGGVIDVIFGAVSGAANAGMGALAAACFLLIVADFTSGLIPYQQYTDFITPIINSGVWNHWGMKLAFDVILICILCGSFRVGYRAGICSMLVTLVILGLIGGAGYGSYIIASSDACAPFVTSISDGMLAALPEAFAQYKPMIATIIVTVVLFLILLIVIIILGIFLPKLVDKLRDSSVFMACDGVLGAIVLTAFVFGLLLAVGGILYGLGDSVDLTLLDEYMNASKFADCMYALNPFGEFFSNLVIQFQNGFGLAEQQ